MKVLYEHSINCYF